MLAIAMSVFAALLAAPLMAQTVEASEDLARARALLQNGTLPAARTAFARVLENAAKNGDEPALSAAQAGLARVDLALGHYKDSIAEATHAIAHLPAGSSSSESARLHTTLGQARFISGDLAGALRDYESGLRLGEEAGDREVRVAILNNIGSLFYSQGRYGEAFARYQDARRIIAESSGAKWVAPRLQVTDANLAVLYQRLGQYSRALQTYQSMGASTLPPAEKAQMLSNMGTLYRRLGDPVKALETYRAAQTMHDAASLPAGVGVLQNIGILQTLELSDFAGAEKTFTQAFQIADKAGAKSLEMSSLLYRGEARLRAARLLPAREDFAQSARLATELKAGEEQWKAAYGLARVAWKQGDLAASGACLRDAANIIERMRQSSATSAGRNGFLADRRDVYDMLIDQEASTPLPDVNAVFQWMEKSRARTLQDRLGRGASTLTALRKRLAGDTLILDYWCGPDSLAVIWISRSGTGIVYRRLAERDSLVIHDFPAALADPLRTDWTGMAAVVSKILLDGIAPLADPGVRRLIVVPDGSLSLVPFEVLPFRQTPLIARASVSYLPFASAFRNEVHGRGVSPPWKKTLLAFADPTPGSGQAAQGETLIAAGQNQKLPDATREVRNAADAVGGRTELYLGREARKLYLAQGLSSVPLLHFATHAFADTEDPERSYILFSPAGKTQGFDYLFLKEVAGLSAANVSLVTVSACDSGSGRILRGEGVQSFSSAFLGAGAKAVLTSLWRIGDRPSAELMARFYASLARGNTVADALREAKLAFLGSGNSSAHPAYWAAFVLAGDGNVRVPRVIGWPWLCAGSLILVTFTFAALALARRLKTKGETG